MFARAQKLSVVLALALILGQVGLAAHAVKHSTTAAGQCVLCLNHVQPLTALPATPALPVPVADNVTPNDSTSSAQVTTRSQYQLQARAPPTLR